uniref:Uncharacterized protein n=1 Tax=Nothobranchius pienaari TaxID=704102 RepID=A0A1A8MH19_9TELE
MRAARARGKQLRRAGVPRHEVDPLSHSSDTTDSTELTVGSDAAAELTAQSSRRDQNQDQDQDSGKCEMTSGTRDRALFQAAEESRQQQDLKLQE